MSLVDPECYPSLHRDDRRVCSQCFSDPDLQTIIRKEGSYTGCDFCHTRRATTVSFSTIADYVRERVETFYGLAVEQLPYESREGGYQGEYFDSFELLVDQIGIDLPRDRNDRLLHALADALGEEPWCAFDWVRLELDESLESSWRIFAETVKHHRRFFFHGDDQTCIDPGDDRSPLQLFHDLKDVLESLGRVRTLPEGYALFRARERKDGERHSTPADLGPPPADKALQSNRMNPPGIPMFYGAETERLALVEVREQKVSLGRFVTTRPVRIVDLIDLPNVPGFFSRASRPRRQHLSFLHSFAREISLPVPRDDRTHIDYLPTQVFTEFLRDAKFGDLPIDGIRYPSALGIAGANMVLFATREDVHGVDQEEEEYSWRVREPWLKLTKAVQKRRRPNVAYGGPSTDR